MAKLEDMAPMGGWFVHPEHGPFGMSERPEAEHHEDGCRWYENGHLFVVVSGEWVEVL